MQTHKFHIFKNYCLVIPKEFLTLFSRRELLDCVNKQRITGNLVNHRDIAFTVVAALFKFVTK